MIIGQLYVTIFFITGTILLIAIQISKYFEKKWHPGPSTFEIIDIHKLVVDRFPKLVDVFLASGCLPDILGEGTSDIDLVKIDDNHQGYENMFGEYLERIKASSSKHPNRTIYTIRFDEYPTREVNIYITSDNDYGMSSVKHRSNEMMLNNYTEIATVAMFLKRFKDLNTPEAWVEALCLNPDKDPEFDVYAAMQRDDLEPIASRINKELIEIYNRI